MSSDGRLALEASANFTRLENALTRAQARIASLEKESAKFAVGLTRQDKLQESVFTKLAQRVALSFGAYRLLGEAIGQVNRAIQNNINLQQQSLAATVTLGEATAQVVTATGGTPTAEQVRKIEEAIRQFAAAGVPMGVAGQTLAEAVNAEKGALDLVLARATEVGRQVSKIATGRELGALPKVAVAVGAVATEGVFTQEEALGMALAARGQARATSLESLASAAAAIKLSEVPIQFDTREQSRELALQILAIWTETTHILQDETGVAARATASRMIQVMDEIIGEDVQPFEAMRRIAGDPELAKRFADEMLGRMESKQAQQFLLREPGIREATAGILRDALQPGQVDKIVSALSTTEALRTERQQRVARTRGELELAGTEAGRRGAVVDILFGRGDQVGLLRRIREPGIGSELDVLMRHPRAFSLRDPLKLTQFGIRELESFRQATENVLDISPFVDPIDQRRRMDILDAGLKELMELEQNILRAREEDAKRFEQQQEKTTQDLGSLIQSSTNSMLAAAQAGSQREKAV